MTADAPLAVQLRGRGLISEDECMAVVSFLMSTQHMPAITGPSFWNS